MQNVATSGSSFSSPPTNFLIFSSVSETSRRVLDYIFFSNFFLEQKVNIFEVRVAIFSEFSQLRESHSCRHRRIFGFLFHESLDLVELCTFDYLLARPAFKTSSKNAGEKSNIFLCKTLIDPFSAV